MNIHTPGGGRVATMAPGPDDLFVVTTISGRKALLHTVDQYQHVLKLAEEFAIRMSPVPVTIKVFCLTLRETQALGFLPEGDLLRDSTPQDEAEGRELAVQACFDVLRNSNVQRHRAEALRLLKDMGFSA
ncbi:hypothetical protein DWF04_013550 [Cereibacter sphaeroides f. sp. denitrificans]|nr:hypothetical protein DWF04_18365 [Cereibacter sphaeroides f. sp. denitrificans]